jgi:tripartite-type tricarboxylate transporter receptor subunit TctC
MHLAHAPLGLLRSASRRFFGRVGLATAVTLAATVIAPQAGAETWPARPVRIIVPFAPGGPDVTARIVGQDMGTRFGVQFIIENKPGANGIIGADAVAKAAPDGYTLMVTSTSIAINPSVYRKLPFDPVRDFTPIASIAAIEGLLVTVNASHPARTLGEFLAWARAGNPVTYGSPGHGNQIHVASALFNAMAHLDMVHVPYKGAGPAVAALLSSEVQVLLVTPPLSLPHIQSGKLRALAYTHSTRAGFLPNVPTMAEAGFPGFVIDGGWFGLFGPAGLPADIVERLNGAVRDALAKPSVRERIVALGLEPVGNSAVAFRATVEGDGRRYAEMVRTAGIKPE